MPSRDRTVALLLDQARLCDRLGSPLYARLLEAAADDAATGGPADALLRPLDAADARAGALALRLMAAVHRLVLTGRAPRLAAYFPSVGGDSERPGLAGLFRETLAESRDVLAPLVELPCQTNEVGRSAALAFGFLELAGRTALPLRLLEVGASAGLNLRFDHFLYGGGGVRWGPPDSPVDLSGLWVDPPPLLPPSVVIAHRGGCDPRPLDPAAGSDRLDLEASVWADQVERLRRLRGALEVAARVPARVERAAAGEWVPRQLSSLPSGAVSVVYHSIVEEYLTDGERRELADALGRAGARARTDAPLAWLRLEPSAPGAAAYEVRLTSWPEGRDRVVARCGPHGSDVRRAAGTRPAPRAT